MSKTPFIKINGTVLTEDQSLLLFTIIGNCTEEEYIGSEAIWGVMNTDNSQCKNCGGKTLPDQDFCCKGCGYAWASDKHQRDRLAVLVPTQAQRKEFLEKAVKNTGMVILPKD